MMKEQQYLSQYLHITMSINKTIQTNYTKLQKAETSAKGDLQQGNSQKEIFRELSIIAIINMTVTLGASLKISTNFCSV